MPRKPSVVLDDAVTLKWYTSMDARAARVRMDIIKGIYWCRNVGYATDKDYLECPKVLLESIKRCGFKYNDAESFE